MRVRGNSLTRTPRVDPALLVASLGSTPTDETALTREDDYEDVLLTIWDIFAHIPARASLTDMGPCTCTFPSDCSGRVAVIRFSLRDDVF